MMVEDVWDRLPDSVDEFTRETEGITLKFTRKTDIPNQNFYEVRVGKKYIGYIALPPFSGNWSAICTLTGNKNVYGTRKEVEDYMLRQIQVIMKGGKI